MAKGLLHCSFLEAHGAYTPSWQDPPEGQHAGRDIRTPHQQQKVLLQRLCLLAASSTAAAGGRACSAATAHAAAAAGTASRWHATGLAGLLHRLGCLPQRLQKAQQMWRERHARRAVLPAVCTTANCRTREPVKLVPHMQRRIPMHAARVPSSSIPLQGAACLAHLQRCSRVEPAATAAVWARTWVVTLLIPAAFVQVDDNEGFIALMWPAGKGRRSVGGRRFVGEPRLAKASQAGGLQPAAWQLHRQTASVPPRPPRW